MQIIKQNEADIPELAQILKSGGTIVYPTETCYGLGCDATNQRAVDRLFKIKQRQDNKPVLVLVYSIDIINKYINWTPTLAGLAKKYWPGPLTVVTKIKDNIELPNGVVGQDSTIAFRITSHHFASSLCKELGYPLVSTSANISAHDSPYDIASVLEMFENSEYQPDIIIDNGALVHRSPSTIVRVIGKRIELLRQGEITISN